MENDKSSSAESLGPAVRGVRWWNRFGVRVTAGVVLYVIVGGIVLLTVPDLLLENWFPDLTAQRRAAFLGPATTAVLFALGGTIALVGVGLSLSRHRQELEAAARDRERLHDDREREQARRDEVDAQRRIETERALRERFVATVKLLSDPAPVNRQAALFALGALSDDWDAFGKPDEVQVCIEVLTGYLRAPRSDEMLMPFPHEEHDQLDPSDRRKAQRTTPQEVAVKQAGYTVIDRHLGDWSTIHWHGRTINLAGAHIDFAVDLNGAHITNLGSVNLDGANITNSGSLNLRGANIDNSGSVNLDRAHITNSGSVDLNGAHITNLGSVTFDGAVITNSGSVDLEGAVITDSGSVRLNGANITDNGSVICRGANIADSGFVALEGAIVTDRGYVSFRRTNITDSGFVSLEGALYSDDRSVDLSDVRTNNGGSVVPPGW